MQSYKFTRKEIEDVIEERQSEIKKHNYYDGLIVAYKPTTDLHSYVSVRGDLHKLTDMTSQLVAFIIRLNKEVDPDCSSDDIIREIISSALSSKIENNPRETEE